MPPVKTQVPCPRCRMPVAATVEQLFDVAQDPAAKRRFLSGRFNLIQCPNCGFQGQAATPLLYHDPERELLMSFVPMELGLPQAEQERLVGRLMNEVINKLPQEQRKGYLLNPKPALTLQGMLDRVLEGEGITREMMDTQRSRAQLIQQLLTTPPEQLPALIKEKDAELDEMFFQILSASLQAQAAEGASGGAQRLADLQTQLIEQTSYGARLKARQQSLEAAVAEVQALGDQLTKDKVLELVLKAHADPDKLMAYVSMLRPAMDYAFFEALTRRVDRAQAEERELLSQLRERLLELTRQMDQATQERMEEASQVLRALLDAPDLDRALRENAALIDETFMAVLNLNLEAASRANRPDVVQRLERVSEAIMRLMQESAPPEVRFINELLAIEDESVASAVLKKRSAEINQGLVDAMTYITENLRQNQQADLAERLERLRSVAVGELMSANWRQ